MEATVISGLPILSIPFLSNTDATRQQMSAKQSTQVVSSINCRRPYVVGNKFRYYIENSEEYNFIAPENGTILYTNNDIMVCIFDNNDEILVFNTPNIKTISIKYSTRIRFKHPVGRVTKGDIIYQYDSFFGDMLSNGYNVNIGFLNICGYDFEDAILISKEFANKAIMVKKEKLLIPVYTFSLFNLIYPESKYEFLPELGQHILDNIIAIKKSITVSTNYEILNNLSLEDISILSNDEKDTTKNENIITKLKDAKLESIRVHKISDNNIIDNNINSIMKKMLSDYDDKIKKINMELQNCLSDQTTISNIISGHYMLGKSKRFLSFDLENLCYVIEIEITKETPVKKGTKLTNRYANKGVISKIIDNLPLDIIVSPTGVFSRMNLGQINDGVVSKGICKCEKLIIESEHNVIDCIIKMRDLAIFLKNDEYVDRINNLLNTMELNPYNIILFRNDVIAGGLYFEVDNYLSVDLKKLTEFIEKTFDVTIEEDITFSKEFFENIADMVNLDTTNIPLPNKDITYKIFSTPMYWYRLKQNAEDAMNARDFGDYSIGNKQPSKISTDNNIKSMRFGQMEHDALISSSSINILKELRGVKSDNMSEKINLIKQMISTGKYNIPEKTNNADNNQSSTKYIIDSMIAFMTHDV